MVGLENASKLYYNLNNLDLAIDFLYDAIEIRERIEQFPSDEKITNYNTMAVMWNEKNEEIEALMYVKKA